MKRRICVVTGSRAEYGLLYWLMKEIEASQSLELQLAVTGMHLSPEFGLTYKVIEADGFRIDAHIEMLLSSDSAAGIAKSIGLGVIGFADAFMKLRPDIVVVLGDRFETFAAVQAALVARIPVAHLHGGETTEGTIDEAVRHSISKMAHLHFTATEDYRQRVIQLGEDPLRVFCVGAAALDNILRLELLDRADLEVALGLRLGARNLLVTFHPVTLEHATAGQQCSELLAALDTLPADVRLIFTKPNADTDGRVVGTMIDAYAANNPTRAAAYNSLGQLRYLSALRIVDGVIGNSSSGLIEAPSFRTGAVNIGDRQKGRVRGQSVIDCEPNRESIAAAIARLLSGEFRAGLAETRNPYGDEPSAGKVVSVLANYPLNGILKKSFFTMAPSEASCGDR